MCEIMKLRFHIWFTIIIIVIIKIIIIIITIKPIHLLKMSKFFVDFASTRHRYRKAYLFFFLLFFIFGLSIFFAVDWRSMTHTIDWIIVNLSPFTSTSCLDYFIFSFPRLFHFGFWTNLALFIVRMSQTARFVYSSLPSPPMVAGRHRITELRLEETAKEEEGAEEDGSVGRRWQDDEPLFKMKEK